MVVNRAFRDEELLPYLPIGVCLPEVATSTRYISQRYDTCMGRSHLIGLEQTQRKTHGPIGSHAKSFAIGAISFRCLQTTPSIGKPGFGHRLHRWEGLCTDGGANSLACAGEPNYIRPLRCEYGQSAHQLKGGRNPPAVAKLLHPGQPGAEFDLAAKQITDMHRGVSDHDAGVRDTQLVLDLSSDVEALSTRRRPFAISPLQPAHGLSSGLVRNRPDPRLPIQNEAFPEGSTA